MNNYNDNKVYVLARDFFKKEFGDKVIEVHSECVVDLAVRAAPFFDFDKDVFIIAGWLHDMGRKIDKDTHPEKSLMFLDKFLSLHPVFESKRELITDCILHHGRKKLPKTPYGKIMQLCDSASMRHHVWKEYEKSVGGEVRKP